MTDKEIITRDGDKIRTAELTWLPLEFLLFNLKEVDRRDLFGQSPTENVLEIAHTIMHANKGIGWVVSINGRPEGVLGIFEWHKGTWGIWSLGVEKPAVALLLLGEIFERAIPHIRRHGGWRIQCRTRMDHTGNRNHLALLGFKIEAVLRHFGTDRSHYVQFVYLLDDQEPKTETVPASAADVREPAAVSLN